MTEPLQALLEQVRQERDLDLGSYKPSFLARRLAVRLRARDCPDYAAYGQLLRRDPDEYRALFDSLAINLTRFFRDPTTFQALEERFLPALLQERAAERRLRLWSAGCAAGEEAYSLAILIREALGADLPRWQIDFLAGDVDERSLARARAGRYEEASLQDVAPRYQPLVERYLLRRGECWEVDPQVRQMVTFQLHDLTRDPVPPDLDLLLCRNVLIYFEREQQERLYRAFYQALRTGGLLILGKTEVLPMSWARHLNPVELREHFYRRVEVTPLLEAQERGAR